MHYTTLYHTIHTTLYKLSPPIHTIQLLEKWLAEDKLEMSEELGDLVMTVDNNMVCRGYIHTVTHYNTL